MPIVPAFVGLDYHENTIRVCVMDRHGQVLLNCNRPNDVEAVAMAIQGQGWPVVCAIEACCGAASFAHEMQSRFEIEVRMAHPGYVNKLKQSPDKSDTKDAHLLADLLRAGHLPEVWLPPESIRQLRHLTRFRRQLVEDRKDEKLRVRALLREQRAGLAPANPWTKTWLAWVRDEAALGEHGRWVMQRHLRLIEHYTEEIHETEKRIKEVLKDDPLTQELLKQPGIGEVSAATLRAEIGSFRRFKNGKQLSRYSGLSPCNASSGKRQADAGLVRAANADLRTIFLECAHRISRYDPHWKAIKHRLRYEKKKPASVAVAAVANRYARSLYYAMIQFEQPMQQAA